MNEINQITQIPKGAIILNKKIYIPFNMIEGNILENSII